MSAINQENSTALAESTQKNFDLRPSESKNSKICKAMGIKCRRMSRVKKNKKKKKDFVLDSGESFERTKSRSYGHKKKKSYNKENMFEKGKKGSYERTYKFKDEGEKKQSIKLKQPKHEENDNSEEKVELRKNKKKGSKKMEYHNLFMKDEYKKDHTINH